MNRRSWIVVVALVAGFGPALGAAREWQTNEAEAAPLWHFEAGG